eukprot:5822472-Alexandrium_andersonii.AAC.1
MQEFGEPRDALPLCPLEGALCELAPATLGVGMAASCCDRPPDLQFAFIGSRVGLCTAASLIRA